jgi:MFS family permease
MKTFNRIVVIEFLIYLASGLFVPAWYKIIFERGSTIEQFGILLGLMALASIASAYIAGWLCDRFNPFKVFSGTILIESLVMLAYIPNLGLYAVYALQILYGVVSVASVTTAQILVAKHSEGKGKAIGTYNSILQGTIGLGMISSGFLAGAIGIYTMVGVSVAILMSAALVSYVRT